MKKAQVVKFWKELEKSTETQAVIERHSNRTGYASERTLQRYSQVHKGFKENVPLENLCERVGWSLKRLRKLKPWWDEAFPSPADPITQPHDADETSTIIGEVNDAGDEQRGSPGEPEAEWPSFTDDQLAYFFTEGEVGRIRSLLHQARNKNDSRLHQFVQGLLTTWHVDPFLPDPWRAAVAGLPILARDINVPVLGEIGKVVLDKPAYKGRRDRKEYHEAISPLLREAWDGITLWVAPTGHLFMPKRGGPIISPPSWEDIIRYRPSPQIQEEVNREIENSLIKGRFAKYSNQLAKAPLDQTMAGLVWDLITRFPDIDRQKGKVFKKLSVIQLFTEWCRVPAKPMSRIAVSPPIEEILKGS